MGSFCSKNVSEHVFDLFENVAIDMILSDPAARAKLQTAYEKYDKYSKTDRQRIDRMMVHVLQSNLPVQPPTLPIRSNPSDQLNGFDPLEPPKLVRQNAVEQL